MRSGLCQYLKDMWNILDVFTMMLFIVGFILHWMPTSNCSRCLDAARVILVLDMMLFYLRALHIFLVLRSLGPKLVMIKNMMVDMSYFIIILMVFVTAYGIALQAILYPNSELKFSLIGDIFKKAYFQIYGELFLDELEGDNGETETRGERADIAVAAPHVMEILVPRLPPFDTTDEPNTLSLKWKKWIRSFNLYLAAKVDNTGNESGVVDLKVRGVAIASILIDSGATCNIMDKATWEILKKDGVKCVSRRTNKKLFTYGQEKPIDVLGTFVAEIECENNDRKCEGEFTVIKGTGKTLLGRRTDGKLDVLRVGPLEHPHTYSITEEGNDN
ncbi:hypothetical protein LSAT2_013619 [Lamellibrachia satsuma]|nr:hypothetical protein LSAT2_013619 [Lamellibrachia satsuma]